MPSFETHTGLVLRKDKRPVDSQWIVTIMAPHEPERLKTLYLGDDETAAQREYAKWKKHYEERAEVEVSAS
jgi:hypothetical protein